MTEQEHAMLLWVYEQSYREALDRWTEAGVGPQMVNHMAHMAGLIAITQHARGSRKAEAGEEPNDGAGSQ